MMNDARNLRQLKCRDDKIGDMSIQDIEQAITQLPPSELTELVSWLHDYHHQIWDQQIEDDLEQSAASNTPQFNLADQLQKLADLHQKGILTDAEYLSAKAKLIS